MLSERTSGTSGVTLHSGPTQWIIITPSMEPFRLLCISYRHIVHSAVRIYALLVLPFPYSIPQTHAICYPELPCTDTARLAPPVLSKQTSSAYNYDYHHCGMPPFYICVPH